MGEVGPVAKDLYFFFVFALNLGKLPKPRLIPLMAMTTALYTNKHKIRYHFIKNSYQFFVNFILSFK